MSEPLTRADLDAIRGRCDKATPGPWFLDLTQVYENDDSLHDAELCIPGCTPYTEDISRDDLIHITHSREDIPRLLAEIAWLEAHVSTSFDMVFEARRAEKRPRQPSTIRSPRSSTMG